MVIQSPWVEGIWNFARVSTMGMPTSHICGRGPALSSRPLSEHDRGRTSNIASNAGNKRCWRVAIAPLDLHVAPMDEHAFTSARRHAERGIEPHHFAVQIGLSIMCSASEESAWPSRRGNGIAAAARSCASCGKLANSGVRNKPGAIVSTRMPNCAVRARRQGHRDDAASRE